MGSGSRHSLVNTVQGRKQNEVGGTASLYRRGSQPGQC